VSQLRLLIGESMLNKYIGEQRTRQWLGNGNVRQLAFQKTSAASASHATALTRYLNQGVTGTLDMHIHTPHRMLHEIRMRKAYTLLESGCQVAQTAYQVGYKFPNNFSAAFTRFFGKSPKSVFGKRR
jgi:AraC-like DNA-binding protein